MAKTLNNLLDEVLEMLREDVVTSAEVSADAVSEPGTRTLLHYMNQIKEEIEEYHQWRAGVTLVTFDTVVDQLAYDLSATTGGGGAVTSSTVTNERSTLLFEQTRTGSAPLAWDITETFGSRLTYLSVQEGLHLRSIDNGANQYQPCEFYLTMKDGGFEANFPYKPDAVRNMRMGFYIPDAELSALTDTITVAPTRPIVLGTYWKALEERGEELGPDGQMAYQRYQEALRRAYDTDLGPDFEVAVTV